MALSKFHLGTSLMALLIKNQNNAEKAINAWKQNLAFYILPDAIRCLGIPRTVTHYEVNPYNGKTSGMIFPSAQELKTLTKDSIKNFGIKTAGDYHQVAIGDETNLIEFVSRNSKLDNNEYYGIIIHLAQDICYDRYIRTVIDCSQARQSGKFYFDGKAYDSSSIRRLITDIEELEFRMLVKMLNDQFNIKFDKNFFELHVKPILDQFYCPEMAEKTWGFITFSDREIPNYISENQAKDIVTQMVNTTLDYLT